MGAFNLAAQQHFLSEKLRNGICIICGNPGIQSIPGNTSSLSFDFICAHCNPEVIIGISDDVLQSDYLDELEKNEAARKELQLEISGYNARYYPLVSDNIGFFLGENYSYEGRTYDFDDWLQGRMGGRPDKYERLPPEELVKINLEQKRIFETKVESRINTLVGQYDKRKLASLDHKELLATEIETLRNLLQQGRLNLSFIPMNDLVDLGNWKKKRMEVEAIQKYCKTAITEGIDYNDIISPNQKVRVGAMGSIERYMVDSVAYKRYMDRLESERRESQREISSEPLLQHQQKRTLKKWWKDLSLENKIFIVLAILGTVFALIEIL